MRAPGKFVGSCMVHPEELQANTIRRVSHLICRTLGGNRGY
jgi:hypothetical protein